MSDVTFKDIYANLSKVDVRKHTETKNKFTYLSWTFAFSLLSEHYNWEHSYTITDIGNNKLIDTKVTIEGITRTMHLAVFDFRNKAIENPNSTEIANSIMRCLTKNISVFGLGLNLYAGEDLPIGGVEEKPKEEDSFPDVDPIEVKKYIDISNDRYGIDLYAPLLAWIDNIDGAVDFMISKNMVETAVFDLKEETLKSFAFKSTRDKFINAIKGAK